MADTFTDNALVQSIGNHLGLGGLLGTGDAVTEAQGGGSSTASAAPPPPPNTTLKPGRSNVQTPREFRQHAPDKVTGAGRGLSPGGNQSPIGLNLPGVMSPDVLMHPAVQQLLSHYGVTPESVMQTAQHASPNLFITNEAAYQKHPVLAGLLERGLEGAAFTKGGSTPGETISNIAQGMLTSQAARADKYNNQLMMPFAQAEQVAQLQGINKHQEYEDAETARANAQAEMYSQMPEYRKGLIDVATQREQDKQDARAGMNHLRLQLDSRFSAMTPEHSAAFQQAIQEAGGLGKFADEDIEKWAQIGATDKQTAETAAKVKVKGTSSGVGGSRGRGGNLAANKPTAEDKEYHDAGVALGAYDKRYPFLFNSPGENMFPDPDNKNAVILRNSEKWKALLAQRETINQRAKKAREVQENQKRALSVPGSGMTSTPVKKNPVYDPATGKIQ